MSTNLLITAMTNLAPILPGQGTPVAPDPGAAAATETNAFVIVTNAGPAFTTNAVVSIAANQSGSAGPGQSAANSQVVKTINHQITTAVNNYQVTLATNLMITGETNQTVSYVTNAAVRAITNQIVITTNGVVQDYFLYTEYTPPPDFTLFNGESLVLLVDGVRHGFSAAPAGTGFAGRRGFTSNLYRVPPEVLVAIANAREVKIRFRGTSSLIEKTMNDRSRKNFRAYLLKYFSPELGSEPARAKRGTAAGASSIVTAKLTD